MQLLLGLFFSSILLTTGTSIQCVKCLTINGYCSDVKEECPSEDHICMSLSLKSQDNKAIQVFEKYCTTKKYCEEFETRIGNVYPVKSPNLEFKAVLNEVTCSKAPPSFASSFPAFLGLLLMKLLF